jgi:type VI secretion system secreted protein Hcp
MKNFRAVFRRPLVWTVIAAIYVVPLLSLQGAVDMFLKLNGIDGESADKTHKDEIDVEAWSWGASNPATVSGGTPTATKTTTDSFIITKTVDKATPKLMEKMVTGAQIPDGTFTVRKAGATPVEYIRILFTDILITSISTGSSAGGDNPQENVSFVFGKVSFDYTPVDIFGNAGKTINASWTVGVTK